MRTLLLVVLSFSLPGCASLMSCPVQQIPDAPLVIFDTDTERIVTWRDLRAVETLMFQLSENLNLTPERELREVPDLWEDDGYAVFRKTVDTIDREDERTTVRQVVLDGLTTTTTFLDASGSRIALVYENKGKAATIGRGILSRFTAATEISYKTFRQTSARQRFIIMIANSLTEESEHVVLWKERASNSQAAVALVDNADDAAFLAGWLELFVPVHPVVITTDPKGMKK